VDVKETWDELPEREQIADELSLSGRWVERDGMAGGRHREDWRRGL